MTFRKSKIDRIITALSWLRENPYQDWYGGKTDGFCNQLLVVFKHHRNSNDAIPLTLNWCYGISKYLSRYVRDCKELSSSEKSKYNNLSLEFHELCYYQDHCKNHVCDYLHITED